MDRHIIHLHIPAFPIAVERVCCPELRDRPVAVAPVHSERALILSASSEARKEGIFKGMPLGNAVKFCPDLKVVPPNSRLLGRASKGLTDVVTRYTPLWEPSRPGHIYLDVTGTERLWGKAREAGDRLRREVRGRLCLPGVVGVSGNKMVSSIASRIVRSEGIVDVVQGEEACFLAPLDVDVLPGIGPFRKRFLLEELHITLVREIAAMDVGSLKLIFGRQAFVIHQRAFGIDPTPVYPPRREPQIAEEVTLAQDDNDDKRLLAVLYTLVERCAHRLRERRLIPRKGGIMVRYADQLEARRHVVFSGGSFWDFHLYAPLEKAFFKACRRRIRVRFIKIWFQDFSPLSPQLSLFAPPLSKGDKRRIQTVQALDRIRARHGVGAIRCGRGGL